VSAAPLSAWIQGVACLGPSLPDWPATRAVLRAEQAYVASPTVLPAPALLPQAERRRASRVIRLALALGLEACAGAGAEPASLATVFASSGADGHNCSALCEQLASDDRLISPTRFHNSVHNAPAGYWSIATRSMAPSQVVCAYDASFGAGLLDALAQVAVERVPVLLVAYDSEYPEPLYSKRPIPDAAGIGLLLAPQPGAQALARISVSLSRDPAPPLADPALERLRSAIPALRGLPLLQALALGEPGRVRLDYLPPLQLTVEVQPC
jgi:hypothetical protein